MTCDESVSSFKVISSSLVSTLLLKSFLAEGSEYSAFRGGFTTSLDVRHGNRRPSSCFYFWYIRSIDISTYIYRYIYI